MEPVEAIRSAFSSLGAHPLRSALTVLGVVFGVGAVIAMLSIGAGAERQALATIARLGLHNVVIRDKEVKEEDVAEVRAKSSGLSLRDCEAIADAVPGVRAVAPKVEVAPWTILAEGGHAEAQVYGVGEVHAELVNLRLAEGRFLDPLDVRDHAQVAVIGDAVRRDLYGLDPALGRHIKVNDVWLEVVGVLGASPGEVDSFQGVAIGSAADAIYMPVSTAMAKLDHDPDEAPLSEILVRLEDDRDVVAAGAVISALLERLHAGQDDYEVVVPEALMAESRRTQRMFNIVMGCIAGISLLVGGIGIANIMLATVLERTREIGIRRAVGARRRDVLFQFLVEAFSLSTAGGLAGVMMGLAIAWVVAASAGWPTEVTVWSILLATGVAVGVGLVSGLYPAIRAARLDPMEALRRE